MRAPQLRLRAPSAGLLALPWDRPLSEWMVPDVALRDIAVGPSRHLVELHRHGVFWGDCSLANTLFSRDGQVLQAWLVGAETSEVHPQLSDGQRELDMEILVENIAAGMLDLAARLNRPPELEDILIAEAQGCKRLDAAVETCTDLTTRAMALILLARAHELRGDADAARACNQRVLEASEVHGESVFRSWALWSIGIESWRNGDRERATELLKRGLQLAQQLRDARTAASYLEVMAWINAEDGKPVHAAVMMVAAETMGGAVGNYAVVFPNLPAVQEESDQRVRNAIDAQAYDAARQKGRSLPFDDAVAYALREG
jgi:hypothetical protein